MSTLKRIRDFKPAKDDASADELRRQLGQFESNVSDMGDTLQLAAMQRLSVAKNRQTSTSMVVAPGQFQLADTRLGTINVGLAKPTAAQAGTFIVLVDLGGAAGSFSVRGQDCKYQSVTTAVVLTVTTFAALIFCDGSDYWRVA
jgi:hypothetical protein